MITRLWGTDIGEFFGASLATGDLNKDGLHDLVIGAPHWGNDNGRVHVYLGSPKVNFHYILLYIKKCLSSNWIVSSILHLDPQID